MYKEASKIRLRVESQVGLLSVEQLWGLSVHQLDELAVNLEENVDKSVRKSFITEMPTEDKVAKLKLNIVIDILETKLASAKAAANRMEVKAHNDKINTLIAEKKDNSLKEMSVEDLEKLLK